MYLNTKSQEPPIMLHGLNRDPQKWFCRGCDQDGVPRVYGTGDMPAEAESEAKAAALNYIAETAKVTHRALAPLSSWGFKTYAPMAEAG